MLLLLKTYLLFEIREKLLLIKIPNNKELFCNLLAFEEQFCKVHFFGLIKFGLTPFT